MIHKIKLSANVRFQMWSEAFMGEFEKVSEITPYLYLTSGTGAEVDSVKVIPEISQPDRPPCGVQGG